MRLKRKNKKTQAPMLLLLRAAVCTALLLALAPDAVDARGVLEDARPADHSAGEVAKDAFGSRVTASDPVCSWCAEVCALY